MIYVSQGHEHSISLEIFVKSFLLLSKSSQKKITLITCKKTLKEVFKTIKLEYISDPDDYVVIADSRLKCVFFDEKQRLPQSTISLTIALKLINPEKDILLTLPTSKDQLIINNIRAAGYTEYFRHHFKRKEISMLFSSSKENVLLITDHIPLSEVPSHVTTELVFKKIQTTITHFEKYFEPFGEVILSGLNPHVGEKKMLGLEDSKIKKAIKKLENKIPEIKFKGPLSGDTLHFHKNPDKKQLFVYMFHDQGLPPFKEQNGHLGLNITLGLPFLRMSVDHGTAFDLYNKNQANFFGCLYLLRTAIKVQKKINKKCQ